MKNILSIITIGCVLLAGCKKTEFMGNNPTGEGLVDFTLTTPVSSKSIVLNGGTPDSTVTFSWNAAKPGLNTLPTYQVVFALRSTGNF